MNARILNPFDSASCRKNSLYLHPKDGRFREDPRQINGVSTEAIHAALLTTFRQKHYVCVGATASFATDSYRVGVYGELGSPAAADGLSCDLVTFINEQQADADEFRSFLAVFAQDLQADEATFEGLLWKQLQLLDERSQRYFPYAESVDSDPTSPKFAFSFAGHALFVVGMHAQSSRAARQFPYPTLAFNLHAQFDSLRADGRFEAMKAAIRRRDARQHGSINPMLADFGEVSEAAQYSGRNVGKEWQCPFHH